MRMHLHTTRKVYDGLLVWLGFCWKNGAIETHARIIDAIPVIIRDKIDLQRNVNVICPPVSK